MQLGGRRCRWDSDRDAGNAAAAADGEKVVGCYDYGSEAVVSQFPHNPQRGDEHQVERPDPEHISAEWDFR